MLLYLMILCKIVSIIDKLKKIINNGIIIVLILWTQINIDLMNIDLSVIIEKQIIYIYKLINMRWIDYFELTHREHPLFGLMTSFPSTIFLGVFTTVNFKEFFFVAFSPYKMLYEKYELSLISSYFLPGTVSKGTVLFILLGELALLADSIL